MAKKLPKYELLYREGRDICGEPFSEIVDFFDEFKGEKCRVLDLGCGQGRDALFIARKGYTVLGVDVSETGIAQMLEDARREGLDVDGAVADIVDFVPAGMFDVILLDRVLHMLKEERDRLAVLERVTQHTSLGGFILIADTPKNKEAFVRFFDTKQGNWSKRKDTKGFLFVQKRGG